MCIADIIMAITGSGLRNKALIALFPYIEDMSVGLSKNITWMYIVSLKR